MTTLVGSLSAYLQSAWSLSSPVGVNDIHWGENWFNSRYPRTPQITITDLAAPELERFTSEAGSLTFKYRPLYVVNVWQQIPTGSVGTQEAQNVQDIRLEVARVFRTGINDDWGGSLTPFCVVLPQDVGIPRHELTKTPRFLRYEITLITTRNNE